MSLIKYLILNPVAITYFSVILYFFVVRYVELYILQLIIIQKLTTVKIKNTLANLFICIIIIRQLTITMCTKLNIIFLAGYN